MGKNINTLEKKELEELTTKINKLEEVMYGTLP